MNELNFTISGEYATKFFRDLYKEGQPLEEVTKKMISCVPELPEEYAKQVILGSKKFIGVNEFTLADDNVSIEPNKWVKPIPPKGCEWGFIAPDGRIFGGPHYDQIGLCHIRMLDRITERAEVIQDLHDNGIFDFNDFALEKRGWIKFDPTSAMAHCIPGLITSQQQDTLVMLLKENKRTFSLGSDRHTAYSAYQIRCMELRQFANKIIY